MPWLGRGGLKRNDQSYRGVLRSAGIPSRGGPLSGKLLMIAAASPVMRVGGYRLRSLEVIVGDLVCSPWLHWSPCQ